MAVLPGVKRFTPGGGTCGEKTQSTDELGITAMLA